MKADPDAQITAAVDKIIGLGAGKARLTINAYHAIGEILAALPSKYGAKRIERVAEGLRRRQVKNFGSSTLRKCLKFFQSLPTEELARLEKTTVSWRASSRLTSQYLPTAKRRVLIDGTCDGEVKPEDLGKKITKRSKPAATMSARSILAATDRATQAIDVLMKAARSRDAAPATADAANGALERLRGRLSE